MIVSDWMPTALGALVLVGLFVGGIALLARASGWYGLSKTYPRPPSARPLRRSWMVSGMIGRGYFQSCLIVGVGIDGLFLSCIPPFNIGTPPMCIPWNALRFVARSKVLFQTQLRLQTQTGIPIELYGFAAYITDRAGPWPD